ncbi:MAG TPA: GNAT family N-acyltransferase [Xanthobacteraceae bacterium]|nr:GNAT family N-acyltransferase [Xanthobacteraceae bacterium]
MLSRIKVPNRPGGRFKVPLRLAGKLVPVFKAYSGFRAVVRNTKRPATLGRLGALEVRLARTSAEIRRAQKLRYDVFYKEMSAVADTTAYFARRDIDLFDAVCDHLLVIDHGAQKSRKAAPIVGTYRLLRQEVAERTGGFYSAGEFDVPSLVARHPDLTFLELGRSCVQPPYRNKRTVELLWHGIWTYVLQHRIDVMIGCASLDGTDPDRLALPLSFLHHYARAPEPWRTMALPHRYLGLNRMPKAAVDPKAALQLLPPLIKGYLRLGAFVGDGAVIDRQFGTTDVLIILPVSAIRSRYVAHFGPGAERHAA